MATENLKPGDKVAHNATIKLKATDAHPHHKEGTVFEVHPIHRQKLTENKWAVDVDEKSTKAKGKGAAEPKAATEDGTAEAK